MKHGFVPKTSCRGDTSFGRQYARTNDSSTVLKSAMLAALSVGDGVTAARFVVPGACADARFLCFGSRQAFQDQQSVYVYIAAEILPARGRVGFVHSCSRDSDFIGSKGSRFRGVWNPARVL